MLSKNNKWRQWIWTAQPAVGLTAEVDWLKLIHTGVAVCTFAKIFSVNNDNNKQKSYTNWPQLMQE